MKFCLKCANGTHKTSDCKFKFFKNCLECGGNHFTFLCMSNRSTNEIKTQQREEAKNLSLAVDYKLMTCYINSTVILPTFTGTFDDGDQIRGMRDSGAQASFISEDVARKHNLKVIKHIDLALSGFNSTVNYDTKVVKVPIWLGDEQHNFEAICVPEINTKLRILGLQKVSQIITKKGYKLADRYHVLGDDINNINLIIGANALYCIPEKNISFGVNGLYSETPLGIMLVDDVNLLSENLDYLPAINTQTVKSPDKFFETI